MRTARLSGLGMILAPVAAMLAIAVLTGCAPDPESRELQFMPDMYRNPALKPQESYEFFADGSAMRQPPEGAIARGFFPYPFEIAERELAKGMENPVPVSLEAFQTGKKYYNVHCRVCHGTVGSGDGLATVVRNPQKGMPIPPELYSEKIMSEWSDGELFHVITMGQGQMPGYATRIDPEHRWAIVHYVRALGVAANPTEADLEAAEDWPTPREDDDPYRTLGPGQQLYLGTMVNDEPQL